MSICGSSESSGAREGAREQLEERVSSLMSAGSCSKSSSLSSHFGGGDMKAAERGGGMCVTGDHIQGESGGRGRRRRRREQWGKSRSKLEESVDLTLIEL